MKRIMFDTNAFDELYKTSPDFECIRKEYEIYITTIQEAEILNIPDSMKDKRAQILAIISQLGAKIVPTPFTWDHIDFSMFSFSSEPSYWTILKHTKGNKQDALIAATAIHNGCILITEDKDLLRRMKRINEPAFSFVQFINRLNRNVQPE